MRGQISLEYLFLSIISISLLSISLFSLMAIRDYAMEALSILKFSSDVSSLGNTANQVCIMGIGNYRSLFVQQPIFSESVKLDNLWIVRFSSGNFSIVRSSTCPVEGQAYGETQIKNENGIIKISSKDS